jgi:hypothetical protein
VPLAPALHRTAPNAVTISWPNEWPAGDARRIGRTGAVSPADLHLVSAGRDVGSRASIRVDGVERARGRRGYNVVAIDPRSGVVLWSEAFDTFRAPEESRRLAAAIDRLPTGAVVAVAVADDGSGQLSGQAVAALRSLGAQDDIRNRYRVSHLVIGVKGAAPGTAVEESGYALLTAALGTPLERIGMEVRSFELR